MSIKSAVASESLALKWETSELEQELALLPGKKMPAKKENEARKELLKAIAETRKEARAKAGKVTALQLHEGGVQAGRKFRAKRPMS